MNRKTSITLRITVAIFLFLAVLELPYGYYTFLRWSVCIVMIISAINSFGNDMSTLGIIFGIIGLLFNPLVPIHLSREVWFFIDIIIGVFLIISVFIKKTHPIEE